MCTQSLKFIDILANSVGPDVMPHFVAFNQSIQWLPKRLPVYKGVELFTHQAHFDVRLTVAILTHRAPPIVCSRRQFQILLLFQK